MQPLSPIVRRVYLVLFMCMFAAVIPMVIFFADGWRYKRGYGFVRTGAIYISVPYPDAEVYVNGAPIGKSGFLERSFYLGNLAPSAYIVHIERDGYRSWDRLLVIEQQLVTDSRAVLIPKETPAIRLLVATSTNAQFASTTRLISRATQTSYTTLFAATTTLTTATTSLPVDEQSGVGLFIDKGRLYARWIQESAFPPSQFCGRPSVCVNEIVLEKEAPVVHAYFFRGGVVYVTKAGVVNFKEIDVRDAPVSATLFRDKNTDIRIVDDTLIAKVGTAFYEISL